MQPTDVYQGMLAETIPLTGANGDTDQRLLCAAAGAGSLSRRRADPPHAGLG